MRLDPTPLARAALAAACLAILLPAAAQAQNMPFLSNPAGPGLSAEDNQMLMASIAKLNATQPLRVGDAESWSNPQSNSSGTSTVQRIFRSGGMPCHLVRHNIVFGGRQPGRDYRLTWCRIPNGEWKIKS